jgi:hypothetical protein
MIEEYFRHDCGHEGNHLGRAEIFRRETGSLRAPSTLNSEKLAPTRPRES